MVRVGKGSFAGVEREQRASKLQGLNLVNQERAIPHGLRVDLGAIPVTVLLIVFPAPFPRMKNTGI